MANNITKRKFIDELVKNNYTIYNVGDDKKPCNGCSGFGIPDWQNWEHNEFKKCHNNKETRWGMRMGKQGNGKFILSLDFDCCGKPDRDGKRMGCPKTKVYLEEYLTNVDKQDGMYSSSTEGNMNVLVDYTNSPILRELVERFNGEKTEKITIHNLEILFTTNQVIPPTQTTCKITGELGQPRKFLTNNMFYVIENDDCFVSQFIQKFLKIEESKQINKPKINNFIVKKNIQKIDKNEFTDKQFEEIKEHGNNINIDYIENYDDWLRIIWCLKAHNIFLYDYAKELSAKAPNYDENTFDKFWNNYDCNNSRLSIATFYNYSKISNKEKFIQIKIKYNPNSIEEAIQCQTTEVITRCFYDLFGDDFIYKDGITYYFNGVIWEISKTAIRWKFTRDFTDVFHDYIKNVIDKMKKTEPESDEYKGLNAKIDSIKKLTNRLQTNKIIKDCVNDSIIPYIERKNIQFELNPYIFCFNNCVYDLKKMEFVDVPNRDDYMIISARYDYREPTEDEIQEIKNMVEKVFPIKEERTLYMMLLATGLCGQTLEKFIIANGGGRNGKGFLNELTLKMLGDYGYTCSNVVLMTPIKDGANPAIANMDNKRFIVYREPDTTPYSKINSSTVKELTGGSEINARGLYSGNTTTNLKASNILECNKKPKMSGDVEDAMVMRLIDVLFRSKFTKDKNEVDESKYIFMGNDHVKKDDYKDKHKFALFHILLEYWKLYQENDYNIDEFIPNSVKERVMKYLTNGDTKLNWFMSNYTKVDDDTEIIKIDDIYNKFKCSDDYLMLNKAEKREYTKNYMIEFFSTNTITKKYYREREKRTIIQEKYNVTLMRNILVGYSEIKEEIIEENKEE